MPVRTLLALLAALPIFSGSAFAWGCDGHQMVALIARAHLTPAASKAVDRILTASPINPGHYPYCQDEPTDLMAVAAPWADDAKKTDGKYNWHQIDIPLQVNSGDYSMWCKPIGPRPAGDRDRPGCIANAIPYELGLVRSASASPDERAAALRYLIHFMGDLSQPLHVADNRDQGGNCTTITTSFMPMPSNLHGLWDYELVTRELKGKHLTEIQLASNIDREYNTHWTEWGEAKTDFDAFMWEAHALAVPVTYGDLKPPIPLEPVSDGHTNRAACDVEKAKVAALGIQVDDRYADKTLAVIHQQIAKAGYRLAALLNTTFR
jgi:hypothetical protein